MDRSRSVTLIAVVAGMAAVAVLVVVGVWVWVAFAPALVEMVPRADHPATLADLTGPWRAAPMRLDSVTEMKADAACRRDPEFPGGVRLALVDARGGGKLPTIYDGGEDLMVDCVDTGIGPDGNVWGSMRTVGPGLRPDPGKLRSLGGGQFWSADRPGWAYASGRVGQGIVAVVVDVAGIGRITATVQNGWYLAWWEVARSNTCCGPPQPRTVTAFDAFGTVLDQIVQGQ